MPHRRRAAFISEALTRQRVARIRRSPLRGWWVRNRAIVAAVTGLVAIGLGLWGFTKASIPPEDDLGGWADRTYKTFRLFSFNGDAAGENWQLHVARVLAPLVVGYAALRALIALFHQQALLMRVRLFARRHVVIAGLGRRGFLLATGLHEAGIRVVVVDRDGTNRSLAGCRERGIPVIVGDATDPEVLIQARCDRALHVVACCATDATNLDVLSACSVLVEDPGWLPTTAHILIETQPLWVHLQTAAINAGSDSMLRVDFATLPQMAAKVIVGASLGVWVPAAGEPCNILANASTAIGRRVAIQAVRTAMASTRDVRLTLVGIDAEHDESAIRSEAPWLEHTAVIIVEPSDPCVQASIPAASLVDVSVAFLCDQDEAISLAQGISLAKALPNMTPVVVNVEDDGLPRSLAAADITLDRVMPVGAVQRVLGPELLLDTVTEALARARHEAYLGFEQAQGRANSDNPSLVPWDDLPESLKESNRRFADSVGKKVAELGGRIVPIQPGEAEDASFTFPPSAIDELGRQEHERWVDDLVADGWRWTEGPKDPHLKLHPLLVAWEDLLEQDRDRDRDSIRSLPALLATAGYTIGFAERPADLTRDRKHHV